MPLPVAPELPAVDDRACGRHYLAQRVGRRTARRGRLRDAVQALNWCHSASASGPGRFDSVSPITLAPPGPPTALQRAVLQRLGKLVDSFGDGGPPVSADDAAAELPRVPDMYSDSPHRLAPYEAEKLRILSSPTAPRDILDVAAPEVKKMFLDVSHFRRSEEPLEAARLAADAPIRPYWDRRLRLPGVRRNANRLVVGALGRPHHGRVLGWPHA